MGELQAPRRLERGDDRSAFSSGARELDEWLQRYAWQNQQANNAVTYVTTLDGRVVGYYAICAAGVGKDHLPPGKRRPTDVPCLLLARLAVDQRIQGRRVGRHLFRNAIGRASQAADSIGAACLLIHARDEQAKAFYLRQVDLLQSPVDALHLVLPMKAIRGLLSSR